VLLEESVAAALHHPDVVPDLSTPLLLLILAPPDNPMDVAGVIGLGMWPGREVAWLGTPQVASGRATLMAEGEDAVILGSQAARYYEILAPGESVVLAGRDWRVSGLLKETGVSNVDNLVVMPLASAQAAFGLPGLVSAVLLSAKEGAATSLAGSLAAEYPALEANTQDDIRGMLLRELELPSQYLGTVWWTAFFVAVLIVANIMNVSVMERTQQVELIRRLGRGHSAAWSVRYTLTETLMLSLGGGVLGALAAVPTAYLFRWTWILTWGEMARVAGLVLAAGLLAGLYPAYRAGRSYPEALHYDELRRQMEQVAAERRAIGEAYRQLVRGREEERDRLARELHDQAIQSLVALKFRLAENSPAAPAEIQTEIDGMIETLREICSDLRPPALDRLGLAAALRSYVSDFSERAGLPAELRVGGDERRLPAEVELSLFRVGQEALANVWKHAQSPKVEVGLWFDTDAVRLTVSDRGRGFGVTERLGELVEAGHIGLVSMHERMELVGGTLRLVSGPGQGTTVDAWVPC
jgi:signal transduction histidine kinase